jgi:hypothetical protein
MDLATATPYRAPTFQAPRGPSADDLVEVIASWGDVVLSVTHVRAGEGFAWEGASVLRATAEGWAVAVPEGASAWALREGEATVEALREGVARVLAADERVCVALGEVTLRLARTAPPEAFPRARGAVGFAAGVAFLFALVATGLAIAAAPEDDGTLARDDTAERAWLAAHVRPYAMRAHRTSDPLPSPCCSPCTTTTSTPAASACVGSRIAARWIRARTTSPRHLRNFVRIQTISPRGRRVAVARSASASTATRTRASCGAASCATSAACIAA